MKRISTILNKTAKNLLLLTVLAGAMASCDSVLGYEEGDCSLEYQIRFKYDYNMKKVDAFAQEVKSVTLYAFDKDGNFVSRKTEQGSRLAAKDYAMTLDLNPGDYDLITWAGLDDSSFAVPSLTPGVSKLKDLTVLIKRDVKTSATGEEGKYTVQRSLPSLFHGRVERVRLDASPDTRAIQRTVTTIPLVKNTNTIRIVIVQVNQNPGQPEPRAIHKERFSYAVYDDNGHMNYDNSLLKDKLLTYLPFFTGESGIKTPAFDNETVEYPAAIAEISVPRLLDTQTPRLEITDKETGKQLLPNNSLIRYLALLKEHGFINMPLQEYLDREDSFGIIFFVDENLTMLKSVIQINDWIIHLNEIEL